jgi:hypothetical protein
MPHLTRSQLDDLLNALHEQAVQIARDYPPGDRAEAIAGEAEALEHHVAANDAEHFHKKVATIMQAAGAVEPEVHHE